MLTCVGPYEIRFIFFPNSVFSVLIFLDCFFSVLIFLDSFLIVKLNFIYQKACLINLNHETYTISHQFIKS